MTWTLFRQQQQCGAQLPPDKARRLGHVSGQVPGEAARDRAAQDHEQAGGRPRPGDYPASAIENRDQDPSTGLRAGDTPSAPDPHADWDAVIQPEQREPKRRDKDFDDLPLPEGK